MLQAYGVLPPVALTGCEYTCPTVAPARLVVVIASGSETAIARALVLLWEALSVTRAVNE